MKRRLFSCELVRLSRRGRTRCPLLDRGSSDQNSHLDGQRTQTVQQVVDGAGDPADGFRVRTDVPLEDTETRSVLRSKLRDELLP